MSLGTKVSLFGGSSISTLTSTSLIGGSGYGGSLFGGGSGSSLFSGYGYGTGLLGSSGLFGYGSANSSGGSGGGTTSNAAPVMTSGATASFAENGTGTVYTATATDANGDTLSYSIAGGADAARFAINSTSGALSFNSSPDFEAPSDSDANNAYVVNLQASDGNGGSDTQTVTVSVTDEVDAAASLTLTTDADTFTATAASTADQTTAFDDTITGVSDDTLNDDDVIDGATGTDRANIDMDDDDFGGFSGGGSMQSVEIVTLSSSVGFDREFDATGVSGVTSWVLNHSDEGIIDLVDLPDTNASIAINDAKDNFTLAWTSTGGDEAVVLSMDDIGASSTPVQATLAGVEDITVSVSGSNFVEFVTADATSITVSGSGDLDMDLDAAVNDVSELDASGMSGDLTADLSDVGANKITIISSGGGDDAVTVKATSLKNSANINLGGGSSDSVTFGGGAVNFQPAMSGVEDVVFAPTGGGLHKFNGTDATGVSRFIVAHNNEGDITLVNTGSSNTLVLEGDDAGTDTVESQASSSLNVHFSLQDGASSATRDKTTVTSLAESSVSMTIDSGVKYQGPFTADQTGSFEAAISGTAKSATVNLASATSIEVKSVENASTVSFAAPSATSLTVTANDGLDLSGSTLSALADVDIKGSGQVELGNLGSTTFDTSNIAVTATALSDNGGTEALQLGTIQTDGTDITLDASGIFGVTNLSGVVDAGAGADPAGDVTLKFGDGGFSSALTVSGKDVTFDVSEAKSSVFASDFNVGETFTFVGSSMTAPSAAHTVVATGEELVVNLSGGGAEDDAVEIKANSAVTAMAVELTTSEITISGSLGGGDDTITVVAHLDVSATASVALPLDIDASGVSNGKVNMAGGSAADTLKGGDDDDTITGGAGEDVMSGGKGDDTFVFAAGDSTAAATPPSGTAFDVIRDFNSSGSDVIDFDEVLVAAAVTAGGAATATIDAQGLATFDSVTDSSSLELCIDAVALGVGTGADGTFAFFEFESDTYVFINADASATIGNDDVFIQLENVTGFTASDLTTVMGDLMLA